MSIWGSLPGDDIKGWKTDYSPQGDPIVYVDVAVNGSWNDCIRIALWDESSTVDEDCMLSRDAARALAARLMAAADEVDERWPT